MRRIDAKLIKVISSGNCFLIIGAGASVSLGYPSWKQLTKVVYDGVNESQRQQIEEYYGVWNHDDTEVYLSFFNYVEKKLGRQCLIDTIQNYFNIIEKTVLRTKSELYSVISKWPISCYITTNWDNEIKKHLSMEKLVFVERSNSDSDMRLLRSDCQKEIYKIHGSFQNYSRMIVTEDDYKKVVSSNEYKVLREKLYSTLVMCPVVIIGYSAQDPDFKEQLERAKSVSSPDHPVYMFASDCNNSFIEKMFLEYNIRIIPYENRDGKHSELLRIIKLYSRFIALRGSRLVGRNEEQLALSEEASSQLIYNNTVLSNYSFIAKALSNVVLNTIREKDKNLPQLLIDLEKVHVSTSTSDVETTINSLLDDGFVSIVDGKYSVTEKGIELLSESEQSISDIKTRFVEFCKLYLNYDSFDSERIINDVNKGLELLFKKRGLEIARRIVEDDERNINLSFDVLDSFQTSFLSYSDENFEKFIDLLLTILQTPSKEVRDYLALLCNGYFIYNILGFDPSLRNKRLQYIVNRDIVLDSNFLISVLAKNTPQNSFCVDLLNKIRAMNSSLFVTRNILREVIDHAVWAITNFSTAKISDLSVYQTGIGWGNVKQNLFVDGAISFCNETGSLSIDYYFFQCFGELYQEHLEKSIRDVLASYGIKILDEKTDWDIGDMQHMIELVKKDRMENDSYRNDLQCETEGELLYLSEKKPFAFVTSATNLQRLDSKKRINHWSPESLYRFFQINDTAVTLDNLYNCMISDLYNCGFNVLNKEVIDQCSKSFYEQADINIEEIKRDETNKVRGFLSPKCISEAKRDYSYPFYAIQLQSKVLRQIEEERKNNLIILKNMETKKQESDFSSKERIQFERMKNSRKEKQKRMENKRKNKKKKK